MNSIYLNTSSQVTRFFSFIKQHRVAATITVLVGVLLACLGRHLYQVYCDRCIAADLLTQNDFPSLKKWYDRWLIGYILGLRELNLSNCGLMSIPEQVWQFSNLQRLDLSNNHLEFIPREIEQFQSLKYLDLRNNLLISTPGVLARLPYRCQLDLSGNFFSMTEYGKLSKAISYQYFNSGKRFGPILTGVSPAMESSASAVEGFVQQRQTCRMLYKSNRRPG